jgi:hypothetical protein
LLRLEWYKRGDGDWCRFDEVELGQLGGHGIFVIWKSGDGGQVSAVLYVGRGSLRDEISKCRRDALFQQSQGLYVTWTSVSAPILEPIAAYVYQQLRPIWGETVPVIPPLPVNLPLSA